MANIALLLKSALNLWGSLSDIKHNEAGYTLEFWSDEHGPYEFFGNTLEAALTAAAWNHPQDARKGG